MIKNRKKIANFKKWTFLILITFFLTVLQSTEIFVFFLKAKPVFVFSFAICCSLFLKKEEAAIFGVICGFFLDCFSPVVYSFSSFILLIFCSLTATLIKKYIKICLINILVLNFLFFLIYSFLVFTFKFLISKFENSFSIWLFEFIPNIVYTTISSIFIFLISKKICYKKKLQKKYIKKEKNNKGKKVWAKTKKQK